MKGAILDKGEKYYTDLSKIFSAINGVQNKYNWLITDCECYPQNDTYNEMFSREYCWLTGEELSEIVKADDFQWIWAVLSGFDKDVLLDDILKFDLPYADGYTGFWKNPISLQNPLAKIEIVPWDSSLTLIISKEPPGRQVVFRVFYFTLPPPFLGQADLQYSRPTRPAHDNPDGRKYRP